MFVEMWPRVSFANFRKAVGSKELRKSYIFMSYLELARTNAYVSSDLEYGGLHVHDGPGRQPHGQPATAKRAH